MTEKTIKNTYTAADIDILEGLSGVRKRPAMYIGSTNSSGLHHLVWEVIDNGVDEALSGFGNKITVIIHKDGSLSVEDEGRGIPVDIHQQTNMPAVQLIFSTLHSGGKFSDAVYKSSAGLHGVGASVTNALSEFLDVTVYRDGSVYHLRFENGGKLVTPLEIIGKTIKHGTLVRFKPDATIFTSIDFKWDTIYNHLQESAFLLKKVRFILKDERTELSHEFYYVDGLKEYVATLNTNKKPLGNIVSFEDEANGIIIECAMQYCIE
ncbi:MAG: ATP-binding protein, partial [Bacilli bacterium]